MNFLFFEIECANCFGGVGKIFSFGYVLTDEHFNILERDDILMNPDVTRWDWYVIKNMVAYDRSIFPEKPKFPEFYPRIAGLFDRADVVAGYAVENDVKFLLDECKRYSLPSFPVLHYDIQRIIRAKYELSNLISLKKALEMLELPEDSILHKSDDDAVYTMRVAEALTKVEGCTLPELIHRYPACDVYAENGRVKVHSEHGSTVIGAKGGMDFITLQNYVSVNAYDRSKITIDLSGVDENGKSNNLFLTPEVFMAMNIPAGAHFSIQFQFNTTVSAM